MYLTECPIIRVKVASLEDIKDIILNLFNTHLVSVQVDNDSFVTRKDLLKEALTWCVPKIGK